MMCLSMLFVSMFTGCGEKGGKCSAINIPSLELESWEIKNGRLIIKGVDKKWLVSVIIV